MGNVPAAPPHGTQKPNVNSVAELRQRYQVRALRWSCELIEAVLHHTEPVGLDVLQRSLRVKSEESERRDQRVVVDAVVLIREKTVMPDGVTRLFACLEQRG